MKKKTYIPPKILEITTEPLMLGNNNSVIKINDSGSKTKPELSDSKENLIPFDDSFDETSKGIWEDNN